MSKQENKAHNTSIQISFYDKVQWLDDYYYKVNDIYIQIKQSEIKYVHNFGLERSVLIDKKQLTNLTHDTRTRQFQTKYNTRTMQTDNNNNVNEKRSYRYTLKENRDWVAQNSDSFNISNSNFISMGVLPIDVSPLDIGGTFLTEYNNIFGLKNEYANYHKHNNKNNNIPENFRYDSPVTLDASNINNVGLHTSPLQRFKQIQTESPQVQQIIPPMLPFNNDCNNDEKLNEIIMSNNTNNNDNNNNNNDEIIVNTTATHNKFIENTLNAVTNNKAYVVSKSQTGYITHVRYKQI